jgi:PhnB protein
MASPTTSYKSPGYHTVTPYIIVEDGQKLIDFLQQAFDGQLKEHMKGEDGKTWHAEVLIGDSHVMIGGARGDQKPLPCMNYIYVPDCDATYRKALAAGATSLMEPADQFYGDRNAGVMDSTGNMWWIATHVEDVPPEELKRRAQAAHQSGSDKK